MTPRIPQGKSRLLLVEGKEDQEFFIKLGGQLTSTDDWSIQIDQFGGKTKLTDYLIALAQHSKFSQLTTIGIVRDADFNTNAFNSVQDAIRNANNDSRAELPVPEKVMTLAKGNRNVIVLIMPSAEREGMLEDLVMDVFKCDPVTTCVDAYFDCLRQNELSVSQERLPKARLRTFITGKNIDSESEGKDSDRQYLSDVFHMSWWREEFWDNPVFDPAKAFLTQLLAD